MSRKFTAITIVIISVSFIVFVMHLSNSGFVPLKALKTDEVYRTLEKEYIPQTDLTAFCVTDSEIILYYDESGITNIYSLDGKFCYGIQTETSRNGFGDIEYTDGLLYIMSRSNRIYIFDKKELTDTFLPSENRTTFFK